jgi:hypothetical protein
LDIARTEIPVLLAISHDNRELIRVVLDGEFLTIHRPAIEDCHSGLITSTIP